MLSHAHLDGLGRPSTGRSWAPPSKIVAKKFLTATNLAVQKAGGADQIARGLRVLTRRRVVRRSERAISSHVRQGLRGKRTQKASRASINTHVATRSKIAAHSSVRQVGVGSRITSHCMASTKRVVVMSTSIANGTHAQLAIGRRRTMPTWLDMTKINVAMR